MEAALRPSTPIVTACFKLLSKLLLFRRCSHVLPCLFPGHSVCAWGKWMEACAKRKDLLLSTFVLACCESGAGSLLPAAKAPCTEFPPYRAFSLSGIGNQKVKAVGFCVSRGGYFLLQRASHPGPDSSRVSSQKPVYSLSSYCRNSRIRILGSCSWLSSVEAGTSCSS